MILELSRLKSRDKGMIVSSNETSEPTPDEHPTIMLHSRIDRPVAELSLLRKSLLFAELAYIAYMPRADAGRHALEMGFPETRFYDRDGAQAYIFSNDEDAVVACRGTEPTEWNDIQADLNALSVLSETAGRVHRGFKIEVDDLWPRLEQALASNRKPLWFTGHSLGGAMAAICAGRCKLSYIDSNPQALFTYAPPMERLFDTRPVDLVHGAEIIGIGIALFVVLELEKGVRRYLARPHP